MRLSNSFTEETRLLFLYIYYCFDCKRSDRGLELHHITGRNSNSSLNAIPICKDCHIKIGHTEEEEKKLFTKTIKFLKNSDYKLKEEDIEFLKQNTYLCENNKELEKWLKN